MIVSGEGSLSTDAGDTSKGVIECTIRVFAAANSKNNVKIIERHGLLNIDAKSRDAMVMVSECSVESLAVTGFSAVAGRAQVKIDRYDAAYGIFSKYDLDAKDSAGPSGKFKLKLRDGIVTAPPLDNSCEAGEAVGECGIQLFPGENLIFQ